MDVASECAVEVETSYAPLQPGVSPSAFHPTDSSN